MTSKSLRLFLVPAVFFAISALAQTSSAATPSGSSPAANPPAAAATGSPTKVGTINLEAAIFNSNEGRRDIDALSKKLEPKQNELKAQNDELEGLLKQLQNTGDKLNDDARSTLVKQIESKKKVFDRAMQDAREDFENQQQEIAGRILQKMGPLVLKYAQDNSFAMIVDTGKMWPQAPLVWAAPSVDITQPIIDAYNVQSGVPAPAAPATGTAKPAATKPATGTGTAPKPATPKPAEPPK